MAGLLIVSRTDDRAWSAATWMFDWVINLLADNINDEHAARELRVVSEANLGSVDLGDFDPHVRRTILDVLRTKLVPAAEQWLTPPDKEAALDLIRELERMAQDTAS